jgi:CBS domain containing-hemolysin-like protein
VSDLLIPIAIIIMLILLNGLFVAAEFAIISVRPTRIAQLAEQGHRIAAKIKQILDHPVQQDRYIATAQIGITIASLALGMYGEHTVAAWLLGPLEGWLRLSGTAAHSIAIVVGIALLTFAHVVVGEMVPKSLAIQYSERTAFGIASIMAVMQTVFYPVVLLLNTLGNGILRLMGIPPASVHERLHSPEELELLVMESREGGLLSDREEQLLHNIFDFGERRVGQVMTPRPRIVAFPVNISEEELQARIAHSPHSRFPIYDGDLDHIIGLLLVKDFVRHQIQQPDPFELKALLRHMPAVPEALPIERLLAAFRRSHVHMALVIDEYGGTAGIVTLEDLVEEVVGEVHDEFDQAETLPLCEVEPGVLIARGDLLLDDLREATPIAVPDADELPEVDTVGGLVLDKLGRPPQPGDQIEVNGTLFTVESVKGLAVWTVRIDLKAMEQPKDKQM